MDKRYCLIEIINPNMGLRTTLLNDQINYIIVRYCLQAQAVLFAQGANECDSDTQNF